MLARTSLIAATTPNMEHLLHPALKNKNKILHSSFEHDTRGMPDMWHSIGTGSGAACVADLGSGSGMLHSEIAFGPVSFSKRFWTLEACSLKFPTGYRTTVLLRVLRPCSSGQVAFAFACSCSWWLTRSKAGIFLQ